MSAQCKSVMVMQCRYCGGPVEWEGLFKERPFTVCTNCGRTNCHIFEEIPPPEEQKEEEMNS